MTQNLNQFTMTQEKGQLTLGLNTNVLSLQINVNSTNTFGPATAVKLIGSKKVEKALPTDKIFGFITFQRKTNAYTAGKMVEVAFDNTVMIMEASGTINAGDYVVISANDTIATSNGTDTIIGQALDSALNVGDKIAVLIKTPNGSATVI
jgi:hypothetical protein